MSLACPAGWLWRGWLPRHVYPPRQPAEWARLPDIGVSAIRVKVDTGARTSALNARHIEQFDRDGCQWVRFTLPDPHSTGDILCTAAVRDVRNGKDSGGHAKERFVIETILGIGARPEAWPIKITLANRSSMRFAMLLARTAIRGLNVAEVNSSPGFEGIEATSGVDVAGLVIEFIERHARPGRTRTRGSG